MIRWGRDLVLAVVIATFVGWAGASLFEVLREQGLPEPQPVGDRVQQAADSLATGDPVYVAADAHDRLSPADEKSLEELARASPNPVRVVVWEGSREAGYDGNLGAVTQLERLLGHDAVYVLWSAPGRGLVDEDIEDVGLSPSPPSDFYGDPALRLTEIVEAVAAAEQTPAYSSDYWGGRGGAIGAGLLLAAIGLPVVLILIGLGRLAVGRRFRMRGGWW